MREFVYFVHLELNNALSFVKKLKLFTLINSLFGFVISFVPLTITSTNKPHPYNYNDDIIYLAVVIHIYLKREQKHILMADFMTLTPKVVIIS